MILDTSLRKVEDSDWDFILNLRNEPDFRRNFYNQHEISQKEHYDYLNKQKINPDFYHWIIDHI